MCSESTIMSGNSNLSVGGPGVVYRSVWSFYFGSLIEMGTSLFWFNLKRGGFGIF